MVQHDVTGRPLFLHRNLDKLTQTATKHANGTNMSSTPPPRWEAVHHWASGHVGVWGEVRIVRPCVSFFTHTFPFHDYFHAQDYECVPHATVFLAGDTRTTDFGKYIGTEFGQKMNTLVQEAIEAAGVV